jgi:hypothetical protein
MANNRTIKGSLSILSLKTSLKLKPKIHKILVKRLSSINRAKVSKRTKDTSKKQKSYTKKTIQTKKKKKTP